MQAIVHWAKEILEEPVLTAIGVFLLSVVAAYVVEQVVCRVLAAAAAKTSTKLDDKIIETIKRPLFLSVVFYGVFVSVTPLGLRADLSFLLFGVLKTLAVILWASVIFRVGGLFLEALANKSGGNSLFQRRTIPLFNMVLKGASFGIALYFLFLAWRIDVTAWLASAGIIGLAVGFAAQDTLANLFAGIFIIADAPYKIGDFIVLDDGMRGKVTRIGFRSTRVLTTADVEITIPNSVIGGSKIVNEAGGPTMKQRVGVAVDAAYGADVDQVREVLLSCTEGISGIAELPKPVTRFRSFGASGLSFELLIWIALPSQKEVILDALHERVYKAFNEAGLEIPFSKHDLYLKEMPSRSPVARETAQPTDPQR